MSLPFGMLAGGILQVLAPHPVPSLAICERLLQALRKPKQGATIEGLLRLHMVFRWALAGTGRSEPLCISFVMEHVRPRQTAGVATASASSRTLGVPPVDTHLTGGWWTEWISIYVQLADGLILKVALRRRRWQTFGWCFDCVWLGALLVARLVIDGAIESQFGAHCHQSWLPS